MTSAPARPRELAQGRLTAYLMPERVTGWVRATAWASLVTNALLIVTGGAVRLTESGLGCPTWPRCTDTSWTSTPEMGVHGVIEFGNRLLTFVLSAVAVLTFLAVRRLRREHPDWTRIAVALGVGIVVQAVVGGVTVRTSLNPWVVGVHFVISAVLIVLAAVLVDRVRRASLPLVAERERPGQVAGRERTWMRGLGAVVGVCAGLAVYLGTLVTGSGPHSGDAGAVARHTFDPYVVTRVHVLPVYVLVAAALLGLALAVARRWPVAVRRMLVVLTAVVALQAAIGYYQYFTGVPPLAVGLHLAGAAALVAVVAMTVDKIWAVTAHPQP